MYRLIFSCLKGSLIALALVLQPLEASAQKREDDEMAEAIGKALEKSVNEMSAMIKATNVDLQCIGKGMHRIGLSRANPQSFEVTEKAVRFFKTPVPERANLHEARRWTVVIDGQDYIDWDLKKAINPWLEASTEEANNVWVNDREISVSRRLRIEKWNLDRSVDIKIHRLTGSIDYSARGYRGDQLDDYQVFNGTCHKIARKF